MAYLSITEIKNDCIIQIKNHVSPSVLNLLLKTTYLKVISGEDSKSITHTSAKKAAENLDVGVTLEMVSTSCAYSVLHFVRSGLQSRKKHM